MSIEKVNPIMIDSVEFYISADGKESGMSISGIVRLLGIDIRNFRRGLLSKLDSNGEGRLDLPERLKAYSGKAFSLGLEGANGAKIITSDVCAAIIGYYAYDSVHVSEEVQNTAKMLYSKFAERGFHEFIKSAVGFIENKQNDQLLSALNELINVTSQLKELQQFASEYKVIREKTTSYLPGCNDLMDELASSDNLLEPTEDGYMSLEGWLNSKGVTLSPTKFRQLAHIVAGSFKSLVKRDPEKKHFKDSENGKTKYNVCVYEPQHFLILQLALNKVVNDL